MNKYQMIINQQPLTVSSSMRDRMPVVSLSNEDGTVKVNFGLYDYEAMETASQALGFDMASMWNYIMLEIRPENPISGDLVLIDDIGNVYSLLD